MTDDPRLTDEQRRLLNEQLPAHVSDKGRHFAEMLFLGGELPIDLKTAPPPARR